jgi:GTP-binding protein EngB required for normal cell division
VLDANPFDRARFLLSVANLDQLPAPDRPELAMAGRSTSSAAAASSPA